MSSGAYHKVEICGVNTARLKTLTPEEKNALLLRAHEGDKEARQALIDGNLRLVLSVVQRFAGRTGISVKLKNTWAEQLFCAGIFVLCMAMLAADTYNPFIYFRF